MIKSLWDEIDVSRETLERLRLYEALLIKWNPRINLVSKATLSDAWNRHFLDSAQLWMLNTRIEGHWVDLGSGAGFPGLVAAVLAAEHAPAMRFTLVESDVRKTAFLQTVARECGLSLGLVSDRIEALPSLNADILSARALAPLEKLLDYAEKHVRSDGICLFPKGETVHKEIAEAQRLWKFDYHLHPSRTESRAAIVEIGVFGRA